MQPPITSMQRARAMAAAAAAVRGANTNTADAGDDQGFAVGGCCGGCGPSKPGPTPDAAGMCRIGGPPSPVAMAASCYHYFAGKKRCAETVIGNKILALAGQAPGDLRIQPVRGTFFLPTRAEITVVDSADVDILARAWVAAVTINGTAQECYDARAPTAATTSGVWSDVYQSRNQGSTTGVPVRWGPFGKSTLDQELIVTFFNSNILADTRDIAVAVWGYCVDSLPAEWTCGQYPGDENRPTF